MNDIITIDFHDETITAVFDQDGRPMVPLRQFCDRLGIDDRTQVRKLKAKEQLWGAVTMPAPSAGGTQETTCIPLNRLSAWLFTIHADRINPQYRERLERYQTECADVLHAHFFGRKRALDKQIDEVHFHLLLSKPLWLKVKHCFDHGYSRQRMRVHLGRTDKELFDVWSAMTECGILPPPTPETGGYDPEKDPLLQATRNQIFNA